VDRTHGCVVSFIYATTGSTEVKITDDQLATVSIAIIKASGRDPFEIDEDTGLEQWERSSRIYVAACAVRALGLSLPADMDRLIPIPPLHVE
jgi:hypothetical protein